MNKEVNRKVKHTEILMGIEERLLAINMTELTKLKSTIKFREAEIRKYQDKIYTLKNPKT